MALLQVNIPLTQGLLDQPRRDLQEEATNLADQLSKLLQAQQAMHLRAN